MENVVHKVGTEFWRADVTEGKIRTARVTVTKVTKVWYFIEPTDELLFHCATRLRRLSWDRRSEQYRCTTRKQALMRLLRWKKENLKNAERNIKALKKELGI